MWYVTPLLPPSADTWITWLTWLERERASPTPTLSFSTRLDSPLSHFLMPSSEGGRERGREGREGRR